MTSAANTRGGAVSRLVGVSVAALEVLGRWSAPPVIRVALALPFLRSGLTRWDPFPTLSIGTRFLFENQFKLHLLGRVVDIPAPLAIAYVTAVAEIVLPFTAAHGTGDPASRRSAC